MNREPSLIAAATWWIASVVDRYSSSGFSSIMSKPNPNSGIILCNLLIKQCVLGVYKNGLSYALEGKLTCCIFVNHNETKGHSELYFLFIIYRSVLLVL